MLFFVSSFYKKAMKKVYMLYSKIHLHLKIYSYCTVIVSDCLILSFFFINILGTHSLQLWAGALMRLSGVCFMNISFSILFL